MTQIRWVWLSTLNCSINKLSRVSRYSTLHFKIYYNVRRWQYFNNQYLTYKILPFKMSIFPFFYAIKYSYRSAPIINHNRNDKIIMTVVKFANLKAMMWRFLGFVHIIWHLTTHMSPKVSQTWPKQSSLWQKEPIRANWNAIQLHWTCWQASSLPKWTKLHMFTLQCFCQQHNVSHPY